MTLSLRPWKSDIAKGFMVSQFFFAGFWLCEIMILMPPAIAKLAEIGYYYGQGWLIIIASLWIPAVFLFNGIYMLNKEFIYRG